MSSFDETTDMSSKEQITMVARYVDFSCKIYEAFLGFFDAFSLTESESLNALTLAMIILKILDDLKLDKSHLVSINTDGANIMSGKEGGEIRYFRHEIPHLLYSIFMSHTLNLCINAAMDSLKMDSTTPLIAKLYAFFG